MSPERTSRSVGGRSCHIEGILVGLLAIGIGAAWAFYGLQLFAILLPIWAFFFGLDGRRPLGVDDLRGRHHRDRRCRGASASCSGSCSRRSRYFWYYAAVVIAGGALGYMLGAGLFDCLGIDTGFLAVIIG